MNTEHPNNQDNLDTAVNIIAEQQPESDAEVALLKQQKAELEDKLHRFMAESENMRRRLEKQIAQTADYAISKFAKDLLNVRDNFIRAVQHRPADLTPEISNILLGVDFTKEELDKVFSQHGITVIEPIIGDNFNYDDHQAISRQEHPGYEAGKVVQVMQVGYRLGAQLLRPASVVVSIAPNKETTGA